MASSATSPQSSPGLTPPQAQAQAQQAPAHQHHQHGPGATIGISATTPTQQHDVASVSFTNINNENTNPPSQSQDQDQDQQHSSQRKRRRRTIACAPCRNRKVKCDFGYPTCARCLKGPGAEACMYESPVHALQQAQQTQQQLQQQQQVYPPASSGRPNGHAPTSSPIAAGAGGVASQQRKRQKVADAGDSESRIRELERMIQRLTQSAGSPGGVSGNHASADSRSFGSRLGSTPGRVAGSGASREEVRKMEWRREVPRGPSHDGGEARTRFWGCSNGSKLPFELEGLDEFIKDLKTSTSLGTVETEMRKLGNSKPMKPLSGDLAVDSNFLKSMLPLRQVAERLVECYFSYVGRMHRILHMQSFSAQVQDIWDDSKQVPCHIIVQLFLVMASVWSVNTPSPLTAAGTKILSNSVAMDWIRWSEAWLFHANIKRPNLVVLQVRCLLILAKEANYTQKNQAWSSAGTLVKLAMSAGCHREPPPEAKISIFHREMRRRIWATILELDLQASLDRGMPPTLQESDYDCLPPLNINDEDIDEQATVLPEEKPLGIVTDSSFQVAMMQSMGLRLRICALVNAPRVAMTSNELALFEEEIKQALSEIPDWYAVDRPGDFVPQQQQVLIWKTLLESNLRRCQLSLYTYSALGGLQGSISSHALQARLEVAVVILCQQQLLIDNVGKYAWCALADVTYHAAFTICHHLYGSDSGFTSSIVRQVIPSITDILISLVQKTLVWLEDKFVVLEKGMREYYFLCVSITFVKTRLWPGNTTTYMQQAADRLSALCYKLFSKYIGDAAGNTPGTPGMAFSPGLPQKTVIEQPFPGQQFGRLDENVDIAHGFEELDFLGDYGVTFLGSGIM
ncbi:hypothetical protein AJ79_01691 [Helicocarpus griseus UAMH5409]|uniref:Zn(2)-C6 fungal-type domain-containing protein n=1 Tax=Helicocarpus griseus UAMH5409 TaxID=1447875 RepID=A0A2B7Y5V4_9EURO|nr:hypothetical protein AJ79_01691 [Helicocarpus griseus UAMH5409]